MSQSGTIIQVLDEVKGLGHKIKHLSSELKGVTDEVKDLSSQVTVISSEVKDLKAMTSSLTDDVKRLDHKVDGIDERLINVESYVLDTREHTALIPAIMDAVSGQSEDLDNHERRIKRLEHRWS